MNRDLLHPTVEQQRQTHKLKRLIPTPNSYFMDVKCGGCNETNVVFSHAQSVIACNNCKNVLTKPTGGKCKITEGSAFKVKHWNNYDLWSHILWKLATVLGFVLGKRQWRICMANNILFMQLSLIIYSNQEISGKPTKRTQRFFIDVSRFEFQCQEALKHWILNNKKESLRHVKKFIRKLQ